MQIPNVLGGVFNQTSPGAVVFEVDGQTVRLDATGNPNDELFIVFGDRTNGAETYGGGRFLYAGPVTDGRVTADFDRAYNPPCVFSPYATCPLPPPQNKLAISFRAGEKKYSDKNYGAH